MMIEELYDALLESGASEEKARAAARAVADFQEKINDIRNTVHNIENNVHHIENGLQVRMSSIESTQKLHSWMLTVVIIGILMPIFLKVFSK